MSRELLIHRCSDPHMWYAGVVGQRVPYLGEWRDTPDVFKSREPAGYVNIVKKSDALVVESECSNPGPMIRPVDRRNTMNNPTAYLILDGAWGSCGKGLLAGKLALDRKPDVIVCNFGPNAGHTFIKDGESIMTQQVPTGAVYRDAKLLIGPGAMIDPKILAKEIEMLKHYEVGPRLVIHPRASVVLPIDKEREGVLVTIGSTRKGTASAACRKIMRAYEGHPRVASDCAVLHKDDELFLAIGQYVVTEQEYDNIIRNAGLIQVESAQGVELSLNRGYSYPTCTGRDVTPEQVMNDVAVPIRFLKQTCLVMRTFPIRVGNEYDAQGNEIGNSGPVFPDMQELTWEKLSEMAGISLMERTTVTKKVRRVFTFSEKQLEHALWIAGPCDIFLNYMNYLDPHATELVKAEQQAVEFYSRVSSVASNSGARVAWLGWGPAYHQVEETGWVR